MAFTIDDAGQIETTRSKNGKRRRRPIDLALFVNDRGETP